MTRGLLLIALLVWLAFGLTWAALHWWIVPRIGEFRPQLEARASQALGVPVRLGAITAQSGGLMPTLALTDVEMLDAQGRVALSLPRILVTLSPRSVWHLGFEQLYIDQPKLDVRRDTAGRITVAGLDFSSGGRTNPDALNWVFSQPELVIHGGAVRWTDEMRQAEPVVMQRVDVVMRNHGRHHDLRVDATPPENWGNRFAVQGRFEQPLLTRQPGHWQDWDGQIFADFDRIDLAELRRYASLGFDLQQGRGALRAWGDVSQGQLTGATADLALAQVTVTLGHDLRPLSLQQIQGRVSGRLLANGFELSSESLGFDTAEGLHWQGGNVRLMSMGAEGRIPARGELQADRLDLAALAQIADRLPLEAQLRDQLLHYAPQGLVESLNASWQGPVSSPEQYKVTGRLRQFALAAVGQVPGVQSLDAEVQLDQRSGHAKLSIDHGSVDLPGIFEEGSIPIDRFSADASWQLKDDQISVDLANAKFSNADAEGVAHVRWHTSDPAKSATHNRFPGVLDLQATLSRADGRRVYRYLPLVIDAEARNYVRDAVQGGSAKNVQFVVKGNIDDIPATKPAQGEFRISADVSNARLAYLPKSLQNAGELPWPVLSDVSGRLLIQGLQLQVKDAKAKLGEGSLLQILKADASIADLTHTKVVVDADMKGPLKDALREVNTSALSDLLGQALAGTVASGNADFKLKLVLPIADINKSTVQGSVTLAGNDIQMSPDTPKLTRARGVVNYTQTGFSVAGVQVHLLGGDAKLEGGWVLAPGAPAGNAPTTLRTTGVASAEGLRQAKELGLLSRLAQNLTGSTAYSATVGWHNGSPDILVTSNLQGMASTLPAPLQKEAQTRLPMRYQTSMLAANSDAGSTPTTSARDRMALNLDGVGRIVYERDVSKPEPRVLRGLIAVGAEPDGASALPSQGVSANVNVAHLDADAWSDVLQQFTGKSQLSTVLSTGAAAETAYLPSSLTLHSGSLTLGGRVFNHIVASAHREGSLWRGNVDGTELSGYMEYRPASDNSVAGSGGKVFARLARLTLTPSASNDFETLLDTQPASLPALDIVVDDFEMHDKHLGRLEVDAVNRSAGASPAVAATREWRLNKLNLITPEATLTTTGNWARINAQAPTTGSTSASRVSERMRTVLNFKLDMVDGGKLLSRFGMHDVVRQASGKIEGQASWIGSPLKPDYPTLGGAFTVNVASGQFLKADPGLAKLLGVLSLQALPRRLTLDFRDVFSEGFVFDFLRGDVTVDKGLARTNNLQMKGVNAAVLMEGSADIANETQDIKVVVVPELNAGTASLIATVINPAVGLGSFLAQMFLRRPLMASATQEFHVTGPWADPKVTKIDSSSVTSKEKKP
ncbi:YhdP family protein [Rhodoferax sp.]|uniref:YhdP family protein n=1 Tax=Rhodoferax sp. TaxID=50421 RepID=UPI00284A8577|nr:YhdP family protein [Rhodoferax sp.]MDR3371004.1 YhdP family protein [Rhodoferax sp.]